MRASQRGSAAAAALLPVALVSVLAVGLAFREHGSIVAGDWTLYALGAAFLLVTIVVAGAAGHPGGLNAVGAALLLAFAVWTLLSAAWSPVPSAARDESLLVGLYAAVLTFGLVVVRNESGRALAVGAVAATAALEAVGVALRLVWAGDAAPLYWDGRLATPIGYPNALAAVFLIGFWPAVAGASARGAPVAARAAAAAGATAILACWLMTQSKGAAVGLVVSAIVFFAVAPRRLRALPPLVLAAALVAAAYRPLTATFRASPSDLAGAAGHAGKVTLALTLAAGVAGLAYAVADRRLTISARASRLAGIAVALALAGAVAAGVAAFFVRHDHPGRYADAKWRAFKHQPKTEHGSSHLLTIGSNRYDTWRVALDDARAHPLAGIGARGFSVSYVRHGRTQETPRRSHSLELDALSEEGVVGLALLAAALAIPLVAVARRARRSWIAAAVLAAAACWLVHASGDWVWTFPAAGVPFFLLLGVGAAEARARRVPLVGAAAVAACGVVVAVVGFLPVWLSARFTETALREDDAARLVWARRLDPLSVDPYLAEAQIQPRQAVAALRRAVAKEPERSELHYHLGLALERAGDRRAARRELERARTLAPRDRIVAAALRGLSG